MTSIRKISFEPSEFYSRQIVLQELGQEGQETLRKSKVTVVGVGGLGSPSTLYLALAGVGSIQIVDQDTLEITNLHRQLMYSLEELGLPKVEVAAETIKKINPSVHIKPVADNLNESNAESILSGSDCVVDGLDNMSTRYLVNRACVKLGIPYIFAGAIGFEGNVSVFDPPETPCLECVFSGLDDASLPTCATRGVMGTTAGLIGLIEATETIKHLTGIGEVLKGKLLFCDFKEMSFNKIEIFKQPDCPICSESSRTVKEVKKPKHTWLCGRNTVNINPPKPMDIQIEKTIEMLDREFKVIRKSSLAVIFRYNGDVEMSLFRNGRMLIKNVDDEEEAEKLYRKVLEKLGL